MKKVEPLLRSRPLDVFRYSNNPRVAHITLQGNFGFNLFICGCAARWLNPRPKTGQRLRVFNRPVKGSRRVWLILSASNYTYWGKTRETCANYGSTTYYDLHAFFKPLKLTQTPQRFFVKLS
jgi:hypothetical protein